MADETVKVLRIDTGESEQTVKGLKDEIKALRDSLLNLDEGSEDYDKAVKKLQKDQRDLDKVMSLSKKTATALDGSYDALVHQMALLKKEWRATNDEARRDELGKQIGNINTQLKELDAQIGNYQRNVGDYSNQICDAFEKMQQEISEFENKAAAAFQTGDAEAYAEAIEEIGKRQTVIDKINNDSDMMNGTLEKRMEGLTSLAEGIAGGFSAVQGIMALCGTESEEFESIMIKLSATMAIVQGVAGIAGMVRGLQSLISTIKALKVSIQALSSTTIVGLILTIVAAVGGLIYSMATAEDETEDLTDKTNELAAAQERYNQALLRTDRQLERELSLKVHTGQMTALEAEEERLKDLEKRKKAAAREVNGLGIQIGRARESGFEEGDEEFDALIEKYKNAQEVSEELTEMILDATVRVEMARYDEDQKAIREAEEETKRKRKEAELGLAKLQADMEAAKKEAQKIVDGIESSEPTAPPTEYDEEMIKDFESVQGTKKKEAKSGMADLEFEARKKMNETILLDVEERAKKELEIENWLNEEKLKLIQQKQDEAYAVGDVDSIIELSKEAADIELEIERQKFEEMRRLREEDLADQRKRKEQAMQITMASFKVISDSLTATSEVYKEQAEAKLKAGKITEAQYKKEMETVKGIQIAQTVISTLAASIEAYRAMAGIPIVGPVLGGVAAASTIAMGAAQVMKIKNTDVSGSGGTPDMGITTPNQDSISGAFEPDYYRNLTGLKEEEQLNQAQRVYILESDIQESNRKVQVRESETTF